MAGSTTNRKLKKLFLLKHSPTLTMRNQREFLVQSLRWRTLAMERSIRSQKTQTPKDRMSGRPPPVRSERSATIINYLSTLVKKCLKLPRTWAACPQSIASRSKKMFVRFPTRQDTRDNFGQRIRLAREMLIGSGQL